MNVCTMIGRLCGDPELKTTPSGVSVVSFSLAVERAYTSKDQERVTDFIPCVAWRQTAEFISRYFRKGQRMGVQGALQSRIYTAKDGGKRTVYEVMVELAYFCESAPAAVPPPPEPEELTPEDYVDQDESLPI